MKKNAFITWTSILLILLWTYASSSKLLNFEGSKIEMGDQVFPLWAGEIMVWLVPAIELAIAGLLIFERTRFKGIVASLGLLLVFTGYIVLIKLNYFGYIPCSCGGVISTLSWEAHFLFNMVFIVLSAMAILAERIKINSEGRT